MPIHKLRAVDQQNIIPAAARERQRICPCQLTGYEINTENYKYNINHQSATRSNHDASYLKIF
jgi:hypothetical protein